MKDDSTTRVMSLAGPKCEPSARILDWLSMLATGPVVELRAIGVSRAGTEARHTERALYRTDREGLSRLAKDARTISPRAEGVYVTLNPLRGDLDGSAGDADVTAIEWLFVDIDPVRPAGVGSTDFERQAAWQVATTIRDVMAAEGWPPPILADSGNGFHLLYRVLLTIGDVGLVVACLNSLADRFDTPLATVDRKVGNPSRICKLYGTLARKGRPTEDRPHRVSAILEAVHPLDVVPRAALEALAASRPAEPAATTAAKASKRKRSLIARDLGPDPVDAFVTTALEAECDKVASTPAGNRNHQLFASAAALRELVNTGKLDESEADARLRDAARQAGLGDAEVDATLRSAKKKTEGKSRDLAHVGTKAGRPCTKSVVDPITGVKEAVDDERRLARIFLRTCGRHDDGPTLRWWNGEFWAWRGGAWTPIDDKELRSAATTVVKAEFERHAAAIGETVKKATTGLIGNVMLSLQSLTTIRLADVPEMPAWLECDGPDPAECLNCRNGIVHLPTLVDRGPIAAVMPSTPRYFVPNTLDCDFHADAPEPAEWLAFLDAIWGDDPESIEALQQWFGYLLTPDTSQQKILLVVGPPRSGKGTIARVLRHLLGGKRYTAAPTLTSLGGQFGCQTLIGKTAAFCGESRIAGRTDSQAIVERLLSISGEDPQSIERKGLTTWDGQLPTRFILLANELPGLGDYSGALPGRLIVFKLTKTFAGREDLTLYKKIIRERDGILRWAIRGWRSLRESGRFIQPASGLDDVQEFKDVNNPIGLFLSERCEVGPDFEVVKGKLYEAWCEWSKEHGQNHPGVSHRFTSRVKTALANLSVDLKDVPLYRDRKQVRGFRGLGLKTEADY